MHKHLSLSPYPTTTIAYASCSAELGACEGGLGTGIRISKQCKSTLLSLGQAASQRARESENSVNAPSQVCQAGALAI